MECDLCDLLIISHKARKITVRKYTNLFEVSHPFSCMLLSSLQIAEIDSTKNDYVKHDVMSVQWRIHLINIGKIKIGVDHYRRSMTPAVALLSFIEIFQSFHKMYSKLSVEDLCKLESVNSLKSQKTQVSWSAFSSWEILPFLRTTKLQQTTKIWKISTID